MYPFIWSKGGGSQKRVIVVEFIKLTEKLLGGALGAVEEDFTHSEYLSLYLLGIKLNPCIGKNNSIHFPSMPHEYTLMKFSTISEHIKDETLLS